MIAIGATDLPVAGSSGVCTGGAGAVVVGAVGPAARTAVVVVAGSVGGATATLVDVVVSGTVVVVDVVVTATLVDVVVSGTVVVVEVVVVVSGTEVDVDVVVVSGTEVDVEVVLSGIVVEVVVGVVELVDVDGHSSPHDGVIAGACASATPGDKPQPMTTTKPAAAAPTFALKAEMLTMPSSRAIRNPPFGGQLATERGRILTAHLHLYTQPDESPLFVVHADEVMVATECVPHAFRLVGGWSARWYGPRYVHRSVW